MKRSVRLTDRTKLGELEIKDSWKLVYLGYLFCEIGQGTVTKPALPQFPYQWVTNDKIRVNKMVWVPRQPDTL